MSSPTVPRLQILAAALLFSTGGAAIKATSLTSWQVASFRSGLAAVVLMLALRAWSGWWRPRVLIVGAAYAATMVLYVSANKLTTAANTIFLQSTAPIYLLLLGPWLLRERLRRADLVLSAALAVGMLMFFAGYESPLATAPNPPLGNALAALSGLTWALTIMGLRRLGRVEGRAALSTTGSAVVAGNLLACVVCLRAAWPVESSLPGDWIVVFYLGVFQIGLAYFWMTHGVRRVPAFETALLLLLEPVLNVVWTGWIHAEWPGPWSLTGCAIILVATLLHTVASAGPVSRGTAA